MSLEVEGLKSSKVQGLRSSGVGLLPTGHNREETRKTAHKILWIGANNVQEYDAAQ